MAVVYLAHDRQLDRPVAIKVLGEPFTVDESFVLRFRREATMAASLSHPNVVQVFDVGEEEGRLFIVMEYVDGETLDALLKRSGRLEPGLVLDLGRQASGALQYAHDRGIVHRDIKPGNLLLRRDGLLKIADFGIARAERGTQMTEAGTILGTAAYLSPEQARGDVVTPQADIYSLGVVLYELFTGAPPFRIETLAQLAAPRHDPVRPIRELAPDVPPAAEAAVVRSLALDPADRPGSAAELAAELGAGAVTGAVTVPLSRPHRAAAADTPVTTAIPRRPAASPWRGARLFVAVAVLAFLAGFGLFLAANGNGTRGDEPETPAQVESVPEGSGPAEKARNLAEWLREHAD